MEPVEVKVESLDGFRDFIKTMTALELTLLIHDLRKHPEDNGHLMVALHEMSARK